MLNGPNTRTPRMNRLNTGSQGFTLVELLVVIAIIGVLVSLLLPAVQAAREAARRAQCQNQLKQFGLGFQNHVSTHGHFPTGGWGFNWVGDADRGFGENQPGGWAFNVLPFVELQNVYDIGKGIPVTNGATFQQKRAANGRMVEQPLGLFYCPSRRAPIAIEKSINAVNLAGAAVQARTDYAANFGDANYCNGNAACPCIVFPQNTTPGNPRVVDLGAFTSWPDTSLVTGISFVRSEVTIAQVSDGTTNTYAVGEKALDPDHYEDGLDPGDDWSMYSGQQDDVYRTTYYNPNIGVATTPVQDRPGLGFSDGAPTIHKFGSPHPGGCFFAMCDGSVQLVSYDVDPEVHRRLGNRSDGETVDLNGGSTGGAGPGVGTPNCP